MSDTKEAPASDRVVTRTDNNPPESVGLLPAADIPREHKEKVDGLRDAHLGTYLTYLRVPAVIEDKDVYDRVTTLAGMVKKAFDAIDKARSAAKKPYLDGGTAVDKAYAVTTEIDDPEKPAVGDTPAGTKEVKLLAELKTAHESLKKRLSAYDTLEYNKAEAARLAEMDKLAESAAADGIVMGESQVGDGAVQSSRSGYGGTAIKSVEKTFEIVDASLVPANLCSPDPAKIRAAIENGAREIPGVHIEATVKTHVR